MLDKFAVFITNREAKMASSSTFNSSLAGLTRIFTDTRGATEGAPGAAYFEFSNHADATITCKKASKSWELYCVKQAPKDIENGRCFGFAVRPEEKDQANIKTMVELINRINYWMGGTSTEKDKQIPVSHLDPARLKDRDFNVPQKNYGYLKQFGLKLAIEDPYQETKKSDVIDSLSEAFANNLSINPETGTNVSNKLIVALEEHPASQQRDAIIEKAKQGYYDD